MERGLTDALSNLFENTLKPDVDDIKRQLSKNGELLSEVLTQFDPICKRLGRLEDEYLVIINALRRIEDSSESGGSSRADLELRIRDLKGQIAQLQGRLDIAERQLTHELKV